MPAIQLPRRRIHYGILIALIGALLILSSHGFGRFAYSMILPPMRDGLQLDYRQTGLLATGNFIGYLVASLLIGVVAARIGVRRVALIGLLIVGSSLALTGLATGLTSALLGRSVTGIGSALVNVASMGLIAAWFAPRRRGLATGVTVAGSGLGVTLSGILVPAIVGAYGEDGWRYAWYCIGAIVLVVAIVAYVIVRESPAKMGCRPVGDPGDGVQEKAGPIPRSVYRQMYTSPEVWRCGLIYLAFGASYVVAATFFAAYLTEEVGLSAVEAGQLWATAGFISIFSPALFGMFSDVIGRARGLAIAFFIMALSMAVFAASPTVLGAQAATVLFGLSVWPIPALIAATTGDLVGARLAPAGIGFVTVLFGIGQAVGPTVGGYVADTTGTFALALTVSAVVALVGALASLGIKSSASVGGKLAESSVRVGERQA